MAGAAKSATRKKANLGLAGEVDGVGGGEDESTVIDEAAAPQQAQARQSRGGIADMARGVAQVVKPHSAAVLHHKARQIAGTLGGRCWVDVVLQVSVDKDVQDASR